MQGCVALLVLCVHVCTFFDQQVANVVTAVLGCDREQSVTLVVCDVAPQHVALDVGLHNLDLIELDCIEYLVSFVLLLRIFVDFLL